MTSNDAGSGDFTSWDPGLTRRLIGAVAPLTKRWFRPVVRGFGSFPPTGGALMVSNHSGGMLTPDVLIFASAFYKAFGYRRPLYTLGHDALFVGPLAG
jgi:1-acyl-sn-glycerol-3-phosphate acyltransferase